MMDTYLQNLCTEHGLTTISVMLMTKAKMKPFTAYLHWTTADDDRECVSFHGETIEEAVQSALREMAERKAELAVAA